MQELWMIIEDFNDITSTTKNKGGVIASTRKSKLFIERIDKCKLMDLGSSGPKFTLRGPIYHRGQRIYENLDIALSNITWIEIFIDACVKVLVRVEFLDHHPILIMSNMRMTNITSRPFKFESTWLIDVSYRVMLKRFWRKEVSMGENMEKSKEDIKSWKGNSFDQVLRKKKKYLARLNGVQGCIQRNDNCSGMRTLEKTFFLN
ncbi:unnamed protein product [Lathyrus sativus]|nr:unnamed protein product [Lathyrus sativus]